MKTTYRLQVLGKEGMYTYGETAASPDLARLAPGSMTIDPTDRLGVHEATWGGTVGARGDGAEVIQRLVLVEAEEHAGQWEIGIQGKRGYRAASKV